MSIRNPDVSDYQGVPLWSDMTSLWCGYKCLSQCKRAEMKAAADRQTDCYGYQERRQFNSVDVIKFALRATVAGLLVVASAGGAKDCSCRLLERLIYGPARACQGVIRTTSRCTR
ncbi:hypothetical protein J6590_037655 [Homalodisca vitripennis]|nr:hypothetical protein J6590_037655 [Homalodisca vitripennis]